VTISRDDVDAAAARIHGRVRPVVLSDVEPGAVGEGRLTLAHEYLQHTGSFKARGAANLAAFHVAGGSMPPAGVTIASGGNAGVACAWAAKATGTAATVFLPADAPPFKVSKLHGNGADVRLIPGEYADALAASIAFADAAGALLSHAYDNPQIAAGAGTLAVEIVGQLPPADTVVVAVGGGGLLAGITAALAGSGVRTVGVEPRHCRALSAALEAGGPIDVTVESVAADSLGARRVSQDAFELARDPRVQSVLVDDAAIVSARQWLWDERRIVVENGGATALAALLSGAYVPEPDENVVVVLCGANTDPSDLLTR
jgi:threonine dehydratase